MSNPHKNPQITLRKGMRLKYTIESILRAFCMKVTLPDSVSQ